MWNRASHPATLPMPTIIERIDGTYAVLHVMRPVHIAAAMLSLAVDDEEGFVLQFGRDVLRAKKMGEELALLILASKGLEFDQPVFFKLGKAFGRERNLRALIL